MSEFVETAGRLRLDSASIGPMAYMIADYHCILIIDGLYVTPISECLRLVDGSPWEIVMTSTMPEYCSADVFTGRYICPI